MAETSTPAKSTKPGLYTDMNKVDGETEIEVYHACPLGKAELIYREKTAAGVSGGDDSCGAPSEQQCLDQVANKEGLPGKATFHRDVVEVTLDKSGSFRGGSGYVFACFKVKAKHLRKGSVSEGGWCLLPNAPIKWVGAEKI